MTPSQASLLLTAQHVSHLTGLGEWPPIGALLQTVVEAGHGVGPLTARDARRASGWARRWEACPEDLRAFYEAHAGHPAVSPALWHLLEGYPQPRARAAGWLYQLHREWRGLDTRPDLFPSLGAKPKTSGLTTRAGGSDDHRPTED